MTIPSPHPLPGTDQRATMSRRRFLRIGGAAAITGAAAVAGVAAADRLRRLDEGASATDVAYAPRADVNPTDLILVSVQLTGGLDFLNTVVPLDSGRYRDLRGAGAEDQATLLPLDRQYGFHQSLPTLSQAWADGELAIVHGVGLSNSTLSHFADTDTWARGRLDVGDGTGWLGRSLDALAADVDPLIGVSIGGLSPSMYGPGWGAVALPDDGRLPWSAEFVEENPGIVAAYQGLLGVSGRPGAPMSLAEQVRGSQQLVRDVADTVGGATDLERAAAAMELFEDEDEGEEEGEEPSSERLIGNRLSLVADLINGGLPTRAYHVVHGDFDTHAEQAASFPLLLGDLDQAIASFRTKLGANASRVVIATWTEFGRRPDWNGNGTDHGTAGTQFVLGPSVVGGHHGEPPPMNRFDDEANFLITGDFRDYLGGLTSGVLGVDPNHAAPGTTRPMELIRA
ncbi:MAG: DUF1501 domain-containing protein [Actinomycetota bacterium]